MAEFLYRLGRWSARHAWRVVLAWLVVLLASGGSSMVSSWITVALLLRISDAARRPAPVPAPLPILGAVAAIGWSRKLRRRIRESQALAA